MNKLVFYLLLTTMFSSFLGCGSGGGGGEQTREQLRFVHAAPTLGVVTLLQDGRPIISNISYGTFTPYVEIAESGESSSVFSVRVDPEFVLPVGSVEETVTSPYRKTALLTESSGTPTLTFIDDPVTEPTSGESQLRFLNALAAEPTIDVYVTPPSTGLSGRSPVVSQLEFKGVSSSFPTEPGDYRVRITPGSISSTESSSSTTTTLSVLYDSKTYSVDSDEAYTMIFIEKKGGGRPYSALSLKQSEEE